MPTWRDDVHTHAALLQRQFQGQVSPHQQNFMRKKHLSSDTIVLIKRKKLARRRFLAAQRAQRRDILLNAFHAWRCPDAQLPCVTTPSGAILREVAVSAERYRKLSIKVSFCVRDDDRHFFEELAEETGRVADRGFHRIWDAIKPMLPKWRNRRKHNMRCVGPTPAQQIQHYCALEAGDEVDYHDLLSTCQNFQRERSADIPILLQLDQLPSRIDVEQRLQRLTAHRAPGPDKLTPTFLRDHGPQIAEPLSQLAIKMWITGNEPLQFKGGFLHSIMKKSFCTKVEGMRGIMLMDVLGKVLHAILRQRFLPTLTQWRHPLQLGGFPRCTTLFATHYLRAFQQKAISKGLSSAVLFLDVKSAFHSMIRQMLVGDDVAFSSTLTDFARAWM